jgi:hypothetical protein
VAHESNSLDGRLPPRIAAALAELARRLGSADIEWMLAGSAARALAGATVAPRDLDIEIAVIDADRVAVALGCVLTVESGNGWSSLRGRCAVEGVEVDVSAGVAVRGPEWGLESDDAFARVWSRSVAVSGYAITLAPPEEQLVRALIAGDWARIAKVSGGGGPPPRPAYVFRRLAAARAVR